MDLSSLAWSTLLSDTFQNCVLSDFFLLGKTSQKKTKVKMLPKLRAGGNLGNAKRRCFFWEVFPCTCDNLEIYVCSISTFPQDAGS